MSKFKLAMAQLLIERAFQDIDEANENGGMVWLNKADYNDSLSLARKLLLESYVD